MGAGLILPTNEAWQKRTLMTASQRGHHSACSPISLPCHQTAQFLHYLSLRPPLPPNPPAPTLFVSDSSPRVPSSCTQTAWRVGECLLFLKAVCTCHNYWLAPSCWEIVRHAFEVTESADALFEFKCTAEIAECLLALLFGGKRPS